MGQQNDLMTMGATRVIVGLSAIVSIIPSPYLYANSIKILSGGGTLELVSGASTGWGTGYPLGSSEVYNFYGPAKFYLAATGATMIATIAIGYTN